MGAPKITKLSSRTGLTPAELTYKILDRLGAWCGLRVLRVVTLDAQHVQESAATLPANLRGDVYRGEKQRELINRLPAIKAAFVEKAIALDNWCYAIFDERRLVSVGWYAPDTPAADVLLAFPRTYIYMYQGITDPEYRGLRLHGIGMARAVSIASQDGHVGLISLIDADNHWSARSAERIGYTTQGLVAQGKIFGRWINLRTPSARALGCTLRAPH